MSDEPLGRRKRLTAFMMVIMPSASGHELHGFVHGKTALLFHPQGGAEREAAGGRTRFPIAP
ncbi:hypothetical protein [Methylobacterium iners]|uniref:hypothetical protein n=1 Tax=Methylobacterium iners TaxID=418707 RepID=UPI001EE2181B|nr:hypothetical protein [Methylobacterium iners]